MQQNLPSLIAALHLIVSSLGRDSELALLPPSRSVGWKKMYCVIDEAQTRAHGHLVQQHLAAVVLQDRLRWLWLLQQLSIAMGLLCQYYQYRCLHHRSRNQCQHLMSSVSSSAAACLDAADW